MMTEREYREVLRLMRVAKRIINQAISKDKHSTNQIATDRRAAAWLALTEAVDILGQVGPISTS